MTSPSLTDLAQAAGPLASAVQEQVVVWRRHLHAHPERSFEEHETSAWIAERLGEVPGLEITRPTATSVMAILRGGAPGPTVAIRADLDALPVHEETGLPFASTRDGVMHACGHDGHTSILLGVATVLAKLGPELPGEVRFLFQHGEETFPGGAGEMVAAGVMEGVDRIIGLHLWSPMPAGQITVRPGPFMAACDVFEITIHGVGGHIAQPQTTVDPIVVGAQVVTALQQIVARNTDPQHPAVLSVTSFHAGETIGVIPPTAVLSGGTNSFDPATQDLLERRITEVVEGVCAAAGARGEVDYQRGYSAVVNDPGVAAVMERTAVALFGEGQVGPGHPHMVGEDVSAFMREAPGCYVFVGAGDPAAETVYEHHHPRFDIAESALDDGVRLLASAAIELLAEGA